jgi:hypothetical protein
MYRTVVGKPEKERGHLENLCVKGCYYSGPSRNVMEGVGLHSFVPG